ERSTEGRLVAGKLVDYTLGLFASRAYAEAHGLPKTAAELGQHPLIGYVPDLIVSPSLDYAAEFSADWRTSFAISSALGQAEAVRSGAGIGILHTFVARLMPPFTCHKTGQWCIRRAVTSHGQDSRVGKSFRKLERIKMRAVLAILPLLFNSACANPWTKVPEAELPKPIRYAMARPSPFV